MEFWEGGISPKPKEEKPEIDTHIKRLIFMRHAQSPFGGDDKERYLSVDGKMDARKIGEKIKAHKFPVQKYFVSSAKRTQQTFAEVNAVLRLDPAAKTDMDELYNASMGDILSAVQDLKETDFSACFIGHNPGISQIVNFLFDGQSQDYDEMEMAVFPPASCAILEWDTRAKGKLEWKDIQPASMKLRLFITP